MNPRRRRLGKGGPARGGRRSERPAVESGGAKGNVTEDSSGDSDDDRRIHARTNLVLKVEYGSLDGFLQDYTTNISQGGTMIRTSRSLVAGEEVELLLSFPGLLTTVALRGVVRWVQPAEGEDQAVGVEFDQKKEAEWQAIRELVQRIAAGAESVVVSATVRILVVEDNVHVANLIRRGLEAHLRRHAGNIAFETAHAGDGREALTMLEQEAFDLLMVDIYLPVMDGETLIRKLRADPRWATIPIIGVSAGGEALRQSVLAAGADFFLSKPIRLADVLSTMRKLVISARHRFPSEEGASTDHDK